MAIPVYVVSGFLGAGKTTFLNRLLSQDDWQDSRVLAVQFETGEESLIPLDGKGLKVTFLKKALEQEPLKIDRELSNVLESNEVDEIWVEWNGVTPFSQLQSLLLEGDLRQRCQIQKVLHIGDGSAIESLLGRTGSALPEQIANSDLILVRDVGSKAAYGRLRHLLRNINPGVAISELNGSKLPQKIFQKREKSLNIFFLIVLVFMAFQIFALPALEKLQVPVGSIINVFTGILLQAVPFLLIGVLLSSVIQVFVPRRFIERFFPKSLGLGMLVAILGGFCLPVCDCASIPVFRSLVKKGVPLPVAVTFMTVTPVINPVVIFSTYYAFNGNFTIVITRVLFGIIVSLLVGLFFVLRPPKGHVLRGGVFDGILCRCGCYEDAESVTTFSGKISLFIRHAQAEFFDVGKYLVLGTFVASLFQVMGTGLFANAQRGAGLALSMVIMMIMAFTLSLCSSSDAVIARSFASQFPMGAIMAFLVFGPMMDIKNVMMLSSGFKKHFIGKLLMATFVISFVVIYLFYGLGVM